MFTRGSTARLSPKCPRRNNFLVAGADFDEGRNGEEMRWGGPKLTLTAVGKIGEVALFPENEFR